MSARLQMKWEWVLGRKFLRLSLKNETQSAPARYRPSKDTRTIGRPAKESTKENGSTRAANPSQSKATVEGDALTALWGAPGQEQGKSVYRFLEAGKLEVVDSVRQKDGTWKEFGRFVVIRQ